jgi:hypothetical protein
MTDKITSDAQDYVPGRLDREAPPRVWLQIDTGGNNDERDVSWPGPEHVTWQDESIGGLEIEYVRADLALPPAGWVPDNNAGKVLALLIEAGYVDKTKAGEARAIIANLSKKRTPRKPIPVDKFGNIIEAAAPGAVDGAQGDGQ